ncbi:MAG: serine/threonine protein kinase [Reyranella sp.]
MAKIYGKRWKPTGRQVGSGGQSVVFAVTDVTNEFAGEYALKRVLNPMRHERFRREIEAVKVLNHPNVIRLVDHSLLSDSGKNAEKQYLVMPIADGGDLSAKNRLAFYEGSIESTLQVASQLTSALAMAHERGIIHRDVKPANVLFTGNGHQIWLTDFGICLLRETDRATDTGEVVGPRDFMAPELEGGGKLDIGPAADVYSLGKLIYYMFSGGVIIPREQISEDKYRRILGEGQRSHLFGQLLDRMVCPQNHRLPDMVSVEREIRRITEWAEKAEVLSLQPGTLAKIQNLQSKARSARTIEANNVEAREQEGRRFSSFLALVRTWLFEELEKIAAHVQTSELTVDAEPFSDVDAQYFRLQVDLGMDCTCDDGFRLTVSRGDTSYRHRLNFFLCREGSDPFGSNAIERSLNSGKFVPARDLRIALVPSYDWHRLGDAPKSAQLIPRFLVQRSMIGQPQPRPVSTYPTISRAPIPTLEDTSMKFDMEWSQYLILKGSEWPSRIEALRVLISESVEAFIENASVGASFN